MTFASIIAGHDPDIWFLLAVVLFVISTVWLLTERAVQPALVSAGLAFVALGWLVL